MALRYVREQTALFFFLMPTFSDYYVNMLILESLENTEKKKGREKCCLLCPEMIIANILVYFFSFFFEMHIYFFFQNTV